MAHAAHLALMNHDVILFGLAVVGPVALVYLAGGIDAARCRWGRRPRRG